MSNTSHSAMTVQGGNFAIIIPVVFTAGKITSVGSVIKHEALESTELVFANAASKTEYVNKLLDNGVTVEMEKVTKVLDAKTGAEKSGSGTDGDKISITTLEVDKAALAELRGLAAATVFVLVPLGEGTDGASDGYAVILGKINGSLTRGTKGNDIVTMKAEFLGTTAVADASFDETDLNTAFGIAADPMGGTAITSVIHATGTANSFDATDLTNLLAGKIVLKAA